MQNLKRKNVHVGLPLPLYSMLEDFAKKARRPVSQLAREALIQWLGQVQRKQMQEKAAAYAKKYAGITDLDQDLEAASLECLWNEEQRHAKKR